MLNKIVFRKPENLSKFVRNESVYCNLFHSNLLVTRMFAFYVDNLLEAFAYLSLCRADPWHNHMHTTYHYLSSLSFSLATMLAHRLLVRLVHPPRVCVPESAYDDANAACMRACVRAWSY